MLPAGSGILTRLSGVVADSPDAPAVVAADAVLTDAQLWGRALDLADRLRYADAGNCRWSPAEITPWGRYLALRSRSKQERWTKYREVAVRAIKHGPTAPSPEEHFDYRGAVKIARAYARQGHGLPVELFVTGDSATHAKDPSLGWDQYHRGSLHVHHLPGDHDTLMDQRQIDDVARVLLAGLQRSRASSRGRPRANADGGAAGGGVSEYPARMIRFEEGGTAGGARRPLERRSESPLPCFVGLHMP